MRGFGVGALAACGAAIPATAFYFLGWVDSWQSAGLGAVIVIGFVVFAAVGAIIANEEEMHR